MYAPMTATATSRSITRGTSTPTAASSEDLETVPPFSSRLKPAPVMSGTVALTHTVALGVAAVEHVHVHAVGLVITTVFTHAVGLVTMTVFVHVVGLVTIIVFI